MSIGFQIAVGIANRMVVWNCGEMYVSEKIYPNPLFGIQQQITSAVITLFGSVIFRIDMRLFQTHDLGC